jgi:hypothetical protein
MIQTNNILDNPLFEAVKVRKNKFLPFLKTTQYMLKKNGQKLTKERFYFNKSRLRELMNTLSTQDFSSAAPIETTNSQGGSYIDLVFSGDRQFAAIQLFEFIPYSYQPAGQPFLLESKAAEECLAYLDKWQERH